MWSDSFFTKRVAGLKRRRSDWGKRVQGVQNALRHIVHHDPWTLRCNAVATYQLRGRDAWRPAILNAQAAIVTTRNDGKVWEKKIKNILSGMRCKDARTQTRKRGRTQRVT